MESAELANSLKVINKIETALEYAHEAKMLLQSEGMAITKIGVAKLLTMDLRDTVESLRGQLQQEGNRGSEERD